MMNTFKDFFMSRVNLKEAILFDSSSLFKEMALLNPHAINKTQAAMQFIQQHSIPGAIIGGIAVANYVHDRPLTPDVDFLTSDLQLVKTVLQKQGMSFQPLASSGDFGGVYVPELDADFLDANEGNSPLNHYVLRTAITAKVGGVSFPIVNPEVLTIMKFVIGRDKDQTDAFKLLPIIRKDVLKVHLKALQKYLPRDASAKTIWSYAQALSA